MASGVRDDNLEAVDPIDESTTRPIQTPYAPDIPKLVPLFDN